MTLKCKLSLASMLLVVLAAIILGARCTAWGRAHEPVPPFGATFIRYQDGNRVVLQITNKSSSTLYFWCLASFAQSDTVTGFLDSHEARELSMELFEPASTLTPPESIKVKCWRVSRIKYRILRLLPVEMKIRFEPEGWEITIADLPRPA